MSFGLDIKNDDGLMTMRADKEYWVFWDKQVPSDAMSAWSSTTALYFDTGYNGAQPPMIFANIPDLCGLRWISRNEGSWSTANWVASYAFPYSGADSNFAIYIFVPSQSGTATNPAYGLQINDENGDKLYDSDMKLMRVGGFETINNPSNPTCSNSTYGGFAPSTTTSIANYGFTKPCFAITETGVAWTNCLPNNDRYFNAMMKYTHSTRTMTHGWYNYFPSGYNYVSSTFAHPTAQTLTAVIDGADYD